jgi:hypothetical protein
MSLGSEAAIHGRGFNECAPSNTFHNMTQQPASIDSNQRRASVRRTAWTVGLVALAIYVAFLLSGVFGR